MNTLTEQLLHEVETLPPSMQQEVVHFVEFLKLKMTQPPLREEDSDKEPTGTKLARLMEEAASKNLFADIKDPAAWQREIRKDRPLPGRE